MWLVCWAFFGCGGCGRVWVLIVVRCVGLCMVLLGAGFLFCGCCVLVLLLWCVGGFFFVGVVAGLLTCWFEWWDWFFCFWFFVLVDVGTFGSRF